MANEGCKYCKYDISEPLIDKHDLITVESGKWVLGLFGFDSSIRYDENGKPFLFIDHMDEHANLVSSEKISISFCPMCGRKL